MTPSPQHITRLPIEAMKINSRRNHSCLWSIRSYLEWQGGLNMSREPVMRDWGAAKAWLYRQLSAT